MNKKIGTLKIEAVSEIVSVFPVGHANAGQLITDSNGKENAYRTVRFSVASEFDEAGREVVSSAKARNRNIWRNTNPDLFDKVRQGMYIKGNIITSEVEPYEIANGRTVNTVTCIQFEDETEKQAISATGRRNKVVQQVIIPSMVVEHDDLAENLGSKM